MTGAKGVRSWLLLAACVAGFIILLFLFPVQGNNAARNSWKYFLDMVQILPGVLILMGLFAVWVPKEAVVRLLGTGSGLKGVALALLAGTMPTGPLYVAFPMAEALLRKGASVRNVMAFLSAWACIKIPQELVELKFLGSKFMALRLGLTVVFVVVMAWMIEQIVNRNKKEEVE
jgi:uncharacterized membrane protein YraQ (UPF0718 family)